MTDPYDSTFPPPRRRLYRSRHGLLFGVCAGVAEYCDLNVKPLRVAAVVISLATTVFPAIILYLILAMILKPAPSVAIASDEEADFWSLCHSHPDAAMDRIRRRRADLDRRLQRLESIVTSPRFELDEELKRL